MYRAALTLAARRYASAVYAMARGRHICLFVCPIENETAPIQLAHSSSLRLSLLSLLTNTLPGPSASEVTTFWRYTNLFIIIIIIIKNI